ncbi:NAD(P)H-binding protein [Hymenobacter negativus]|uniref:NAD(P)H-binding protein n=1 Tax=Hymenobacter negativus TaxID=2795026 RepID=A0ABS3QBD4_9BACT|nr:NAD(P)H-binding protein [Hymenobacter negativus]MBO2008562.1 NAD(P)H-binding protein [Hymenobacter negativus]
MSPTILITGAAGHVGRQVAALLAQQGHSLRLMGRQPERIAPLATATAVHGDYANPASLDAAFAGVQTAFVVSGYAEPGERAKLHRNAFEAAARAGVGHVVYLSFQGASPDSRFPMSRDHYQSEQYLQATGVPYTAVRDNLYLDLLPEMFDAQGIVRGPAAEGTTAFVARDDAARVAATLLASPPSGSGRLDVTGPEALTLAEAAQRLAVLTGCPLRYEAETSAAGRAWRSQLGAPAWEVDTWVGSYEAIAAGELSTVSNIVLAVTQQFPQTLETYFAAKPHLLDVLRRSKAG